jgi:gliding motility-associated-like protein
MKRNYSKNTSFRFCLLVILVCCLVAPSLTFSQATNFYNGGAIITVYPSTDVYVGGHVTNTATGSIHNQGNIELTGDWTNDNPSGGLDAAFGTVTLSGAAQTIKGTSTTTFNNLDCQGGAVTKTINIDTKVGGNTGALSLNASTFNLNGFNCIVTNPASTAITRTTGFIVSEKVPPANYSRVQWNIGNNTGNYTIPFGTSASNEYIPFTFSPTIAGVETNNGNISVATYPTDVTASNNNRPLPNGVTNLDNKEGVESAPHCADRFWIVDQNNYSTNPTADYGFTYRDSEWNTTGGSTNTVKEDSLTAWSWDGAKWLNPPIGAVNISTKMVSAPGVNFSAPWTLKEREPIDFGINPCMLGLPNAFSPNGDNHNDLFILHGWSYCVTDFTIVIYDRWGEKVYESQNPSKSWDGNNLFHTSSLLLFISTSTIASFIRCGFVTL